MQNTRDPWKPKIETLLVDLWPEAERQLGFKSKSQFYSAVKSGFVPVVRVGPRRWKMAKAVPERLKKDGVLTAEPASDAA